METQLTLGVGMASTSEVIVKLYELRSLGVKFDL